MDETLVDVGRKYIYRKKKAAENSTICTSVNFYVGTANDFNDLLF